LTPGINRTGVFLLGTNAGESTGIFSTEKFRTLTLHDFIIVTQHLSSSPPNIIQSPSIPHPAESTSSYNDKIKTIPINKYCDLYMSVPIYNTISLGPFKVPLPLTL